MQVKNALWAQYIRPSICPHACSQLSNQSEPNLERWFLGARGTENFSFTQILFPRPISFWELHSVFLI